MDREKRGELQKIITESVKNMEIDRKRELLITSVTSFAYDMEIKRMKRIVVHDKIFDEKELISNLLNNDFSSNGYNFHGLIKDVGCVTNGRSYELQVITNYQVDNNSNLSVFKIRDGVVYWKDDFANPSQNKEGVEWENVDFEFADMRINQKGKFLSSDPIKALPVLVK